MQISCNQRKALGSYHAFTWSDLEISIFVIMSPSWQPLQERIAFHWAHHRRMNVSKQLFMLVRAKYM